MASNAASTPTVSDGQHVPTVAERPAQRSFRGVLRNGYEEEGEHLTDALFEDLDSTGLSDEEIEDRTEVAAAQLSRIRQHKAHAPGKLITWAIENSRHRPAHYLVAVCASAEGTFTPRPPPSVEERHEATLQVLHDMGIGEVVAAKVAALLGRRP